jgi:hypothetical protein
MASWKSLNRWKFSNPLLMCKVNVSEEVGLVVVEGFLELPILFGVVVHADNNIGNLCVVADMPAHTLLALQHETGVSVGLPRLGTRTWLGGALQVLGT